MTGKCKCSVFTKRFFSRNTQRKSPSTLLLAFSTKSSRIASFKLAMCLMSKWFRFGLFQQPPSTKRVPSLAGRVAYLRYSINLQLYNRRVPALIFIDARDACVISFWVHAREPVNYYFEDFFPPGDYPLYPTFAEKSFANFFAKSRVPYPQLTEFALLGDNPAWS